MVASARRMAKGPIEIVVWLDYDDPTLKQYLELARLAGVLYQIGPRNIIHSARWDKCLPLATGELLCHGNDDIIFRTPGWDQMVIAEFEDCPDKILMVHGDDLYIQREGFGCHPIISRRWLDTLGYFIPPYFDGEWGDTWVNDLANRIGRRKFLPFICEHLHFSRTKENCPRCGRDSTVGVKEGVYCNSCGLMFPTENPVMDETTQEYLRRSQVQNPAKIYEELEAERIADAEKLRALLGTPWVKSN
jgi:ribosomal protein L37E